MIYVQNKTTQYITGKYAHLDLEKFYQSPTWSCTAATASEKNMYSQEDSSISSHNSTNDQEGLLAPHNIIEKPTHQATKASTCNHTSGHSQKMYEGYTMAKDFLQCFGFNLKIKQEVVCCPPLSLAPW